MMGHSHRHTLVMFMVPDFGEQSMHKSSSCIQLFKSTGQAAVASKQKLHELDEIKATNGQCLAAEQAGTNCLRAALLQGFWPLEDTRLSMRQVYLGSIEASISLTAQE